MRFKIALDGWDRLFLTLSACWMLGVSWVEGERVGHERYLVRYVNSANYRTAILTYEDGTQQSVLEIPKSLSSNEFEREFFRRFPEKRISKIFGDKDLHPIRWTVPSNESLLALALIKALALPLILLGGRRIVRWIRRGFETPSNGRL